MSWLANVLNFFFRLKLVLLIGEGAHQEIVECTELSHLADYSQPHAPGVYVCACVRACVRARARMCVMYICVLMHTTNDQLLFSPILYIGTTCFHCHRCSAQDGIYL